MSASRPTLLALRALGLGDLLTAVPALRALRAAFPDHVLTLAAPGALEPLARLTGAVDEVAPTAPLAPLAEDLSGAALAVNLHGRGPQSHRVLLAARPLGLLAFRHEDIPDSHEMPAWRSGEREVDRWCRMLAESGVAADPDDLLLEPPPVDLPEELLGVTIVHPGAGSAARRWPPERFAAVAAALAGSGHRVVVTGSGEERALAEAVAGRAGLGDPAVLAGRTTLLELTALVSRSDVVVCGDTGIAHLASAYRRPSVVLFGPTSPAEWGPPEGGPHAALWAGSRGDPHGVEPDPGLLRLSVAHVIEALHALPLGVSG